MKGAITERVKSGKAVTGWAKMMGFEIERAMTERVQKGRSEQSSLWRSSPKQSGHKLSGS